MKERGKRIVEKRRGETEEKMEGVLRDRGKDTWGKSPISFNQVERGDFTEHAEGIC